MSNGELILYTSEGDAVRKIAESSKGLSKRGRNGV
jgi:hypothetical protein